MTATPARETNSCRRIQIKSRSLAMVQVSCGSLVPRRTRIVEPHCTKFFRLGSVNEAAARTAQHQVQEDAPGMVFWHPRGYAIDRVLEAPGRLYRGPRVSRQCATGVDARLSNGASVNGRPRACGYRCLLGNFLGRSSDVARTGRHHADIGFPF